MGAGTARAVMATLLFLCLKAAKVVETSYDWPILCLLVAIEGPGYLNAIRLWMRR